MSEETKQWWKSKTIIGVVVMLLGLLFKALGWSVSEEISADLSALVLEVIGAGVAIYGRATADKKLTK